MRQHALTLSKIGILSPKEQAKQLLIDEIEEAAYPFEFK
jgi:hypothetical protein